MRAWRRLPRRLACVPSKYRLFSTSLRALASAPDNNAFAHTLLLPKTSFPLKRDPAKEVPLRTRTCEDLYHWQWEHASGPLFVFHDGPPYANGDLHMGHALNKILKDIINRYHVSIGDRVHYVPGWDCHGLPIENKVLKQLGKDAHEVPATTIRSEAEKYAREQVASQQDQFRQFGIMAGWTPDTTYRTLDHAYEMRQLRVFQTMVSRGMIYRHFRPVHYSPSSHSALAEAELEYKDNHVSHAVYVSFDLDLTSMSKDANGAMKANSQLSAVAANNTRVQLLVWTTTPWTLTANMAIAVNPDMDYTVMKSSSHPDAGVVVFATARHDHLRSMGILDAEGVNYDTVVTELKGSDIAGASYRPLFSSLKSENGDAIQEPLPILSSSHVTPESGTGLVHCAPAHGHEDYALFRAQGLLTSSPTSLICHVDDLGRFTSQVMDIVGATAGEKLAGREVLDEGGKAMVSLLRELGVLRKVERMKHRYPYDWKTDKPVIIMATSQWFANLDAIKGEAIAAVRGVQFYPPQSRNRLESFILSRSEWCISRQRCWGVPIPALYHLPTQRAVLDDTSLAHILTIIEQKGVQHWWDAPVTEFVPAEYRVAGEDVAQTWTKGTDTMDVWFDSGTSWSMLQGLAGAREDGEEGRYADVCLEGSDQHRGWFQSQLLTAVGAAPAGRTHPVAPYGTLITHGMVLDEKGRKMSKSLGNILSPLTILHGGKDGKKEPAYGVEVLRLWAATVESGKDTPIGPTVLSQCVQTQRKIRNSARFILGNLGDRRQSVEDYVNREDMGLAERYALHKVHELDSIARAAYATYNFPKVVSALSNFANITLSSFYLDITKDRLYANAASSLERRAIITVMEQILKTMVNVMGPIVPQLAQEIHEALIHPGETATSVFAKPWEPVPAEWHDVQVETDMNELSSVRRVVLALLEKARGNKQLKSSLEAEVDLVLPENVEDLALVSVLRREENFLKELFITSDATLTDEGSLGVSSPDWVYTDSIAIPNSDEEIAIRVRPATLHKCPRCWTYTREENETLCQRCADVVG